MTLVWQAGVVLVLGIFCMWLELLREFDIRGGYSELISDNAAPWFRAFGINVPVSMASIGMVLTAFDGSANAAAGMTAELIMMCVAILGVLSRALASEKAAKPRMSDMHWQLGVVVPCVCAGIVALIGLGQVGQAER